MSHHRFAHEVIIHKSRHHEAEAWCREHFGARWAAMSNMSGTWCCFWAGRERFGGYRYHFADESAAVMFALKWAGS